MLRRLLRRLIGPTRPTLPARPGQPAEHLADYRGRVLAEYAPDPNGRPDPGEIVWTWVPFEDDPSRGKDRPVLLVGHDLAARSRLLGLMLTSKDHTRDLAREARYGRHWVDIGSGAWDRQRRPSEVRVDRVLRIDPAQVRREGATVDRGTFDTVITALRRAGR
jgi:hypothetical protein